MSMDLSALDSLLIAANVRARPLPPNLKLVPGTGREGDLLVGRVYPPPGQDITVLDQELQLHHVSVPRDVVAVLGTRDSSTHVCAVVPAEGLAITPGLSLHWVGGPSGIIGRLVRDNDTNTSLEPERSAVFECIGLLSDASGRVLNVRDFAVRPQATALTKPLILVAATSSEAGKTVLTGKLIRSLSRSGLRVGAIKATGTGGGLDGVHYRENGAAEVLDQVDAGLIATHLSAAEFKHRIGSVFHRMEELEVDVVVAELGGDLVSANNPAFFELDDFTRQARLMVVIANDALAALGVSRFAAESLRFPADRIRYVTSPFRNHDGMRRRFARVGIPDPLDPNDEAGLAALARAALR